MVMSVVFWHTVIQDSSHINLSKMLGVKYVFPMEGDLCVQMHACTNTRNAPGTNTVL